MTVARVVATEPRPPVEQARADLLAAFVDELNRSEIAYCLLSGYHGFPQAEGSDVDFMVRPADAARIQPLMQSVARRCGALLVQAIQHETGAWYFALAKQIGDEVAYLHPDCTTDYRRNGRLWLRAEKLLAGRRRLPEFWAPAAADEFEYYLIKKVLKQHIEPDQLQRLRQLYLCNPAECSARMRRIWPAHSVGAIVSTLLSNNVARMRSQLPRLLRELQASKPLERQARRAMQFLREWRRWLRRMLRPTGMGIAVCGGSQRQRSDFAAGLEARLRPAFRRTRVVDSAGPSAAVRHWLERVRSTLVIRTLAAERGPDFGGEQVVLHLQPDEQPDLDLATQVVLAGMANRVMARQPNRQPNQG